MKKIRRSALFITIIGALILAGCSAAKPTANTVPNTGGNPQPGTVLNVPETIPLSKSPQPVSFSGSTGVSVLTTTLQANQPVAYQLPASAGQHLFLLLNGTARYQVYGPDANVVTGILSDSGPVNVSLNQTGNYDIALSGAGNVTMSLYLSPAKGIPSLVAPVASQLSNIPAKPSGTSSSFQITMQPAKPLGYSFPGFSGQTVSIQTTGSVTPAMFNSENLPVTPATVSPGNVSYNLSDDDQYTIALFGTGPVTVNIQISPAPQSQATPIPKPESPTRVSIDSSNATVTEHVDLAAGKPKAFVVQVPQGQVLIVLVTGNTGVTIYGPGGEAMPIAHPSYTQSYSTTAYQTGDYTVVIDGSGPTTLTLFLPEH